MMKLPNTLRPCNSQIRECQKGIDLPSWFFDDLKAIDNKLYIVWHPFRQMWENLMNQYEGELEDPRFTIHREHGKEVWGFVMTNGSGEPLPEQAWHVWRLCEPHGWAHIVRIDSKAEGYLKLLTHRLHVQAQFRDKYGDIAWNRHIDKEQTLAQQAKQDAQQEVFEAVQDENKWLMKNAMDNMARGKTAPTNPTVEKIISYGGQKNHTATSRPLDDADVGLKSIHDL
jgi:hypothetical protein